MPIHWYFNQGSSPTHFEKRREIHVEILVSYYSQQITNTNTATVYIYNKNLRRHAREIIIYLFTTFRVGKLNEIGIALPHASSTLLVKVAQPLYILVLFIYLFTNLSL